MIAYANQFRTDVKRWAVQRGGMRTDEDVRFKSVEAPIEITRDETDGPNGDYFEFVATANTASIDLDDEVVVPEGADPAYFFRYRTIYLNHNISEPVGTLRYAKLIGGSWQIGGTLLSSTTVARDARELVRHGIIRGVSIGFVGTDFGRPTKEEVKLYGEHSQIIRRWRWLETSITPMPANPDAVMMTRMKSLIRPETAFVLGLDGGPKEIVLG